MASEDEPLGTSRVTLAFSDEERERNFLSDYGERTLGMLRVAYLLGLVLYGVFGILDAVVVGEHKQAVWVIRFGVGCPGILLGLISTWTSIGRRLAQPIVCLVTAVAGLGIVAMVVIADPPGSDHYYAGLILVLMFGYTFARMRFVWACTAAWIVVFGYEAAVLANDKLEPAIFVNNNFFLLGANAMGMVACYEAERRMRREHALTHRLRELALHDPLTGLLNRRGLEERVGEAIALKLRYSTPTAFLLLDLDDFKLVNDHHGHAAGDALLRDIAGAIRKNIRDTDLAYRYGGDEFFLLLPWTDAERAKVVAARLRGALTGLTGHSEPVRGSIGLAELADERSAAEVVAKIDGALYRAKELGKDQVQSA